MAFTRISRRHLLQGAAAIGTVAGLLPGRPAFAADTVVGFIYVGPRDDYGYNQAHAQGAAALKKMPGVKVVEEENVPETDAVEKTMELMINLDGATLLFPTSFGYYDPHMLKIAAKYPKIRFEHCGGLWTEKDPKNAASYFGYIDEAQYVTGIVAGHTSKTGKLGFVAAKPIPQVLRNINAFTLGAQTANPDDHHPGHLHRRLVDAGQGGRGRQQPDRPGRRRHHLPCRRAQDGGRDRGAAQHHGDCGYHCNQAVLAPKAYLTGAEWNWEELYPKFAKMFMAGETIPNFYRGGLKEGLVKVSAYGPAVGEAARKAADTAKAKLMAGGYAIFKGPITDNKGKMVIASGQAHGQTDPVLERMDYLVEGVVGSTS